MKLIIVFLLSLVFNSPVKAAQPTIVSEEKTKDIVNIVKQIVNENITPTPTVSDNPKSFYGNITEINEESLTLVYKNKTQLVKLNDETVYIDLKRNKTKLSSFKAGQEVLAMGYLNAENILSSKRIVATEPKSIENNYQTITGQIIDISQETSIFSLSPNHNKNNPFQLKTDSKTKIINTSNKTIPSSQAIITGKKIIAIIQPDPKTENTFYATKIIFLDTLDKSSITPTKDPQASL